MSWNSSAVDKEEEGGLVGSRLIPGEERGSFLILSGDAAAVVAAAAAGGGRDEV